MISLKFRKKTSRIGVAKERDLGLKGLCDYFQMGLIRDRRVEITDWERDKLS